MIHGPGFDPDFCPVYAIPGGASGGDGPGKGGGGCVEPYNYSKITGKCELFE